MGGFFTEFYVMLLNFFCESTDSCVMQQKLDCVWLCGDWFLKETDNGASNTANNLGIEYFLIFNEIVPKFLFFFGFWLSSNDFVVAGDGNCNDILNNAFPISFI